MDKKQFFILIELNENGSVKDYNVLPSHDSPDFLKTSQPVTVASDPKASKCPNCSCDIEFTFLQLTGPTKAEDRITTEPNLEQKFAIPNDHDYEGCYEDDGQDYDHVQNESPEEDTKPKVLTKLRKKRTKIKTESKPRGRLKRKVKRVPNDDGTYECPICSKNFPTESNLNSHEYYCKNKKRQDFKCDSCDKTFALFSTLKVHMTRVHCEKSHVCHMCGASFCRQAELEEHLLRHENPKPYECHICKERYAVKNSLRDHIKTQHITSFDGFFCTLCPNGKKYPNQHKLAEHKDRVHASSDRYQCATCPKRFKYPESLRNHITRHHAPEHHWISCEQCNFRAPNIKGLKKHQIMHLADAEKPFKCSYCQKGFSRRYEWNRHEMIHREEKPFKCLVCGHMCRTNYLVQKHMRIHIEGKAYVCSLCDKTYRDRDSFKKHLRAHKSSLNENVKIEIPPHPGLNTSAPVAATVVSEQNFIVSTQTVIITQDLEKS